jgi:hypothetical protein
MAKENSKSKTEFISAPRLDKTIVRKARLSETSVKDELKYWLSKKPEERISAVEILRRQQYAGTPRLQRTVRIAKRAKS